MRILAVAFALTSAIGQTVPTFRVETLVGADIPGSVPALEWSFSRGFRTMTAGPDGSVWFQERGWRRLSPDGRLHAVPIQGVLGPECDYSGFRAETSYRIALDPNGLPHIFDPFCEVVRRLHPDGRHEIVVGKVSRNGFPTGNGGPAKDAQLGIISSLAFDPQGNLYLLGGGIIRKVDTRGVITEFARPPVAARALAVNRQGNIFVAETAAPHRVVKFEADGTNSLYATGNGDPKWFLYEIAFDGTGNLYGRSPGAQPVLKLSPQGKLQGLPDTLTGGDGFAVDRAGNVYFTTGYRGTLFAADPQGRVRRVAGTEQTAVEAGLGKYADLLNLQAVAGPNSRGLWLGVGRDGNRLEGLYLLDPSSRLQLLSSEAVRSMAFDSTASLYYTLGGEVLKLDSAQNGARVSIVPQFDRVGTTSLAVDRQDRLFLTYTDDQQHVARFDPRTGERTVIAGNGSRGDSGDGGPAASAQLMYPASAAPAPDGSVYIADNMANRVRKVDPSGRISTVAGTGVEGIGAEGVPAVSTPLARPYSVAVDAFGNLYIGEWSDSIRRIRLVDTKGIIRTIAGGANAASMLDGVLSTEARLEGPAHFQITNDGTLYFVDGRTRAMRLIPEATDYPRTAAPGIVHGATYQAGPLAPGMILTIFGKNLGPATITNGAVANGRLGNIAGQTSVRFDGVPAPILYASSGQIGVVVPYAVTPGKKTSLVVAVDRAESTPVELEVVAASPGIFTANSTGRGPGAILNQDGSVNSASKPAPVGSIIVLFGTGEGQTTPGGVDGRVATGAQLPRPQQPVSMTICGERAEVLYAGAAPGAVAGLFQVNALVPSACAGQGAAAIRLMVGAATSPDGVTVAVE